MEKLRAVKGMNDILPGDVARWRRVEETFRSLTSRYGFGEVRTPVVEPTALFLRSIGDTTDIVEKEMYSFVDKGDHALTLRPEGTASAVRAFIEHTVYADSPVTKWTYVGPMYRRERPAKGRYRQFYQLGAEVFGDPGPHVDAELIEMLVRFLETLGAKDVEVLLNSLGSADTRARYREALVAHLRPHAAALSEDSQRRLDTNPLRILDSKAPADQAVAATAPSILDFLSDDDRAHFEGLKGALTALGVPFSVDPSIVRGLDYYTRTLFEVKGRGGQLGAQDTICGGGRYDGLVADLGGPAAPAIGFAIGIERLLMVMDEADAAPDSDVFVVTASPALRDDALLALRDLRSAGLSADADLRGNSLKSQMRRADKSGARVAVIVGEDERARGAVLVRNLEDKSQTEISLGSLGDHVRRLLGDES
jgi:histidyl-tRNA synthetase